MSFVIHSFREDRPKDLQQIILYRHKFSALVFEGDGTYLKEIDDVVHDHGVEGGERLYIDKDNHYWCSLDDFVDTMYPSE